MGKRSSVACSSSSSSSSAMGKRTSGACSGSSKRFAKDGCKDASAPAITPGSTPQFFQGAKQTLLCFDDIDDVEITDKYDPTYSRSTHEYNLSQEVVIKEPVFGKGTMQEELTDTMRAMLIDWLVTVVEEYSLSGGTLHHAVQLIDRCLRLLPIKSQSFQLVGCACLLIAAKLDEVQPPLTSHLVNISDNAFSIGAIVQMEQTLLNLLDFNIVIPTRMTFSARFALAAQLIAREKSFLHFILELTLLDYTMNRFVPSLVTAACVHYTLQMFRPVRQPLWSAKLRHYTGYEEAQLREVVFLLQELHEQIEESGWKNSMRKYASAEHHATAFATAVRRRDLRFESAEH